MKDLVKSHRLYFNRGVTRQIPVRLAALRRLDESLREMEEEIISALMTEAGKPRFEAYLMEIGILYREIAYVMEHLEEWAKTEEVGRSLETMMGKAEIHKEPLGVVLIIVPYNYPVQLALAPLIAAVAAGNSVIIKTSRSQPQLTKVLQKLTGRAFRPGHVSVVGGSDQVNEELLAERFDKIMFTGSTAAGRQIMARAAQTLTPVLLELSGKNPAIVLRDADVVAAARKIAWGKFINAGQTCIAPDYVLVHRDVKTALVEELRLALYEFYGTNPIQSTSYGRVKTKREYDRLKQLLTSELNLASGGAFDDSQQYIAPTVVTDPPADHPLMQEEIFGPILPVKEYSDINQVLEQLRSGEKPLAAYVFGQDTGFARKVILRIPSGGGCINETILHISSPELPFGGIGSSGMGSYHGKFGFDAFTQQKPVVTAQANIVNPMLYPPYEPWKENLLRRLIFRKKSENKDSGRNKK